MNSTPESNAWNEWSRLQTAAHDARRYLDTLSLAKAFPDRDEEEDIEDLTGRILGQRGYGGAGSDSPRGVPQRRPVSSSGRGASELTRESSDVRPGDGSTEAAARLGRQLAEAKATLKSFKRALQEVLDDEDLGGSEQDVNQRQWPEGEPDERDVLAGRAMHRASIGGVLAAIGGAGVRSLPIERLAKATGAIGAMVEEAANRGELEMVEEIACGSLLSMLPAASSDPRIAEEFARRLATSSPVIRRCFGVG